MALHEVRYFSDALAKACSAFVVHPDAWVPRPYHCVLLLHGLSDDYTIWQRRTSIERTVDGKPLIVVMPDGGRSFYVDARRGPAYLTALATELPALLHHWYRIDGRWATAGLSMGGYGALRIALEHPGRFRAAASHSGALLHGRYIPKPGGVTKYDKEFLPIFGPAKPGGKNDLIALAQKADPKPALRIDCGTEDFLLEANQIFHKEMTEAGIAHEYEEHPGAHTWEYWDKHIPDSVDFILRELGKLDQE